MTANDKLSVADIRTRLSASLVARQIYLFGEVDSTNATARRLAVEGVAEGTTVIADAQTAGRGRRGGPWFSPAGVNLYASVLFHPGFHAREAGPFALIAPLALSDSIRDLGLSPAIKWPNDVLVNGKRVAGSVVDCVTRGEEVTLLVLGAAVNVNVSVSSLRAALGSKGQSATSLSEELGGPLSRSALAAAYLSRLDSWVRRYREEGATRVLAAWRDRDIITDRRIEVRGPHEAFEGRAVGIDAFGQLVVDASGHRRVLTGEEILMVD